MKTLLTVSVLSLNAVALAFACLQLRHIELPDHVAGCVFFLALIVTPVSVLVILTTAMSRASTWRWASALGFTCVLELGVTAFVVYALAGGVLPWSEDVRGTYSYRVGEALVIHLRSGREIRITDTRMLRGLDAHLAGVRRRIGDGPPIIGHAYVIRDDATVFSFDVSVKGHIVLDDLYYSASPSIYREIVRCL